VAGADEVAQRATTTRTTLPMNQPWQSKAACRGLDAAIFFPDPDVDDEALPAKAVCAECAVRESCLEYALGYREKDGVWGGATERERRRIIRQRRRSA
jgi:WhiB family redox-sensing transcriptional regulator